MTKLRDMPNISRVNEEKLIKAGIETPEQLRALGSKEALLRVRLHADPGVCCNMLYGLEGAIQNMRWFHLSDEVKADLKAFHQSLK